MPSPTITFAGATPRWLRQRRPDLVVLGIAVLPHLRRRLPHGGDHLGRRAEHALIRPDAGAEQRAGAALQRLRPDEGHGGGERLDKRREGKRHQTYFRQSCSSLKPSTSRILRLESGASLPFISRFSGICGHVFLQELGGRLPAW